MQYNKILEEIYEEVKPFLGRGKVADYIPALGEVDSNKYGIAIATVDGDIYKIGDAGDNFSIQSISKVFTLTMAFAQLGDKLWESVDVEPVR